MVGMMCVPFDAGGRPLRPRQRTARRRRPASINTPIFVGGLGILQRSGGRGDPCYAGRGKFLLTVSVNKTRRASQTILERSDREESRLREGKIPVERLDQGVSVARGEAAIGWAVS